MKKTSLAIILLALLFSSCKKDEIKIDPNNQLLGVWNVSEYDGNTTVFNRSPAFIDGYGYEFKSDGFLIERKNSGFCGTPPIVYADFTGTWYFINDTLIQMEVGYWGGTMTYQLDIESIDAENLKATFVFPDN